MLKWMITFFILAIVASVLGFGGLAGTFMGIAKFLAVLFMVLFIGTAIAAVTIGQRMVR